MYVKNFLVFLVILAKFHDYKGCGDSTKSVKTPSPPSYNLGEPVKVKLPKGLNDVSGIFYYAKDTSVFAVVDNDISIK